MTCINNSVRRLSVAIIVGLLAFVTNAAAQKKSSGAAAPAASTPGAQSQGAAASNAPFEVQMLSYGAMDQILQQLAEYACDQSPTKVVILDSPTLQSLEAFDSFYVNAETLKSAFEAMTSAGGAGGGIDDFADITNAVATMATSSTSESSFSFTIQDPTVAIALLHHLQEQDLAACKGAYYAGVYTVHEVENAKTANGQTLNNVSTELKNVSLTRVASLSAILRGGAAARCAATKTVAIGLTTGGTITGGTTTGATTTGGTTTGGVTTGATTTGGTTTGGTTTAGVTTGGTTTGGTTSGGTTTGGTTTGGTTQGGTTTGGTTSGGSPILAVSSQDPCVAAFNNLDGSYNSFLAGLSTPNATTGQPGLSSILQGYHLRALLGTATKDSPILGIYINVAAAGGTQQDRKNIITALFTGDWIRYSGGVSLNVIVFKIAGDDSKILFSDLLRYRTPLKTISKPKGYNGAGSAGDNLGDLP
jgi:hypothetical protein